MMSVELENNTDAGTAFDVQEVRIELSSAIVAQFDWGGKKVKCSALNKVLKIGVVNSMLMTF